MALKDLSEVAVTVEAHVDDIASAGTALSMWGAARRKDQYGGSMVMDLFEPRELVASAIPLVVHLLRRAGHHHLDAHDEVRHGLLSPGSKPTSTPWLSTPCMDWCDKADACDCDVEASCRILGDIVKGTVAVSVLRQFRDQFAADRLRTRLELVDVSVLQATVIIEASALLVAHRWHIESDEVFAQVSHTILAANT